MASNAPVPRRNTSLLDDAAHFSSCGAYKTFSCNPVDPHAALPPRNLSVALVTNLCITSPISVVQGKSVDMAILGLGGRSVLQKIEQFCLSINQEIAMYIAWCHTV